MEKKKTKQLFTYQFDHPFESLQEILHKQELIEIICAKEEFKIKKFIGSDWAIKDSGFIFYGPNNLSVTFALKSIEINDFNRIICYQITYLNEKEFNNNIEVMTSLIRNTSDNSTIIEFRLNYNSTLELDNLEKSINLSSIKKYIMKIYFNINKLFFESFDKNKNLIINHSFIIKKNYKDAFNFFYNWNYMAKSIKADKTWKIIINENNEGNNKKYKDFDVIINKNTKLHYHINSIEEIEKEKIEIIYNKTNNSNPALNNYIKFSFFNISENKCFFLYETHLPANIVSSIYQKITYYLYYCNKKLKNYIENN